METNSFYHKPLKGIKKIGVFRALQLGDMLCSIPAIRAIKQAYPDAALTLIGLPWQQQFVKRFGHYFSGFIEFPGWPGLPEREYTTAEVMQFLSRVQSEAFDLVLQMQGNGYIVNPMCMLFGARYVAGLRREDDYCPDGRLFPVMHEEEHEILRFLRLANAVGALSRGTELEFPIFPNELRNFGDIVNTLSLPVGRYVCIHPGARDPRRRWTPEKFAYLGDHLAGLGYTVLLTGGGEEKEVLQAVAGHMNAPTINVVERLGHLGLGELGAVIGHASALLSNDTGISHIAAALKVPSVIIFSPYSDPRRWAPLNPELHTAVTGEQTADTAHIANALSRHLDTIPVSAE